MALNAPPTDDAHRHVHDVAAGNELLELCDKPFGFFLIHDLTLLLVMSSLCNTIKL